MLNRNQKEAVNTIKGPLLIVAGPGSGKTKTIVDRATNMLINHAIKPENLLISTFTDKSAKELIIRINEKLHESSIDINLNEMYIGTMHSIWLKIIDENIEESNFLNSYSVMDDSDQIFFIYSKMKLFKKLEYYEDFVRTEETYGDFGLSKVLRNIFNKINEHSVDISSLITDHKSLKFLKSAYSLYENLLFEENTIDFSYIQMELYNLLLNNPKVLEKMQNKIEYLMIDEYQDTNKIQEKIILLLSRPNNNICVVGDDDQAIYRFRGATVENIILFSKRFKEDECKIIKLDINYRSTIDIVDFSNKWINSIDWKNNRFEKELHSNDLTFTDTSSVINLTAPSIDKWHSNLVKFVKNLKATNRISDYNQIVFLFDSFKNQTVRDLEEIFERNGIPIYCPRANNFFKREEIKLVLGCILAMFPIIKDKISSKNFYYDSCLNLARLEAKKDEKLLKWILDKKNYYENEENIEISSLNALVYELFQFEYFKNILDIKSYDAKLGRAAHNLSILTKIFEKFQHLCKIKLINKDNLEQVLNFLFLNYLKTLINSGLAEFEDKGNFPKGNVAFLSIHQSKGLEFPVVVVGSLSKGPRLEGNKKEKIYDFLFKTEELKINEVNKELYDFYRKYYVAFSRAENLLVLTGRSIDNTFRPLFNSLSSFDSPEFKMSDIKMAEEKNNLEKPIISFTRDISNYMDCPLKYFFFKKLSFTDLDTKNKAYGILIHKIIENLHKNIIRKAEVDFNEDYLNELVNTTYYALKKSISFDFNNEEIFTAKNLLLKYVKENAHKFKYIFKAEDKEYLIKNNYLLYGEIDLINKYPDRLEIIDLKTGKYDEENTYKNNVYKMQLQLYYHFLKQYYKNIRIEAYIYYVQEESPLVKIDILEEEMEEYLENIETIVENIISKNYSKIDYDGNICKFCSFKYYCYGEL